MIHHKRIFVNGLAYHYVVAGEGQPLVLLHGFPQTWVEWRRVMALLSARWKVIAPQLRGIGGNPGPASGYDKHTLATDVRAIVEAEDDGVPAVVCGHDLGAYVAYAYALQYRKAVKALITVDAPLPGTAAMDAVMVNPRTWHIPFHSNPDVASMLIGGRERRYIEYFIKSRIYDSSAITRQDIDEYAEAYAQPGALRSALEMYRELSLDKELNPAAIARDGRLEMPVIGLGSSATTTEKLLKEMLDEVAIDSRAVVADRCGHWIPEERPDLLTELIEGLLKD